MKSVLVLLSTYNGEKYLAQLLESVLHQQDVNVRIFARDDGSSDRTVEILEKYAINNDIEIVKGDNIGYADSFWWLLSEASGSDYYAFADQDDIWKPRKLATEIDCIDDQECAALCTGNVVPVDAAGKPIDIDLFPVHGPLTLSESLRQSILPGCSFLFNEEARCLAARHRGRLESHDWALYTIVTACGVVEYCEEPGLYYRLHGGNTIGSTDAFQVLRDRIVRFLGKSEHVRSRFAQDLLAEYGDVVGEEERAVIGLMAEANQSFANRFKLATCPEKTGLPFRLSALLGKV